MNKGAHNMSSARFVARLCSLCVSMCTFVLLSVLSYGQATPASPALQQALQQVQSKIGTGDLVGAQTQLAELVKQHPSVPSVWYLQGYTFHQQKKYQQALASYERVEVLTSGAARNAIYNMACAHAMLGNIDQAFKKLDEAIAAGFNNTVQIANDAELVALRADARFQKYQPEWLPDERLFVEPSRVIHQWFGESAGDQFGWTARRVGDLDRDGVIDFVATAPTFNSGNGKIYVYSSKTGSLLHSLEGQTGYRLGNSAVGLGDVNQDGTPDLIAGAPAAKGTGAVLVFSGKDASTLHRIDGTTPGGQFGYEVSELGDIDQDGIPDFFVGEMAGNGSQPQSGRGYVYSGRSGKELFSIPGEETNDGFGNAAACAPIDDGDYLLAIGAQNAGPSDRGRVYVYRISKLAPKLAFTIEGDDNSVNLGQMFISFPGDIDQDGVPDVFASDFSDSTRVPGGGKVVVASGRTGKNLVSLFGEVRGEGLGTSPSDAGDVNQDGLGDLIIGAWQNGEGAQSAGKVYLYSCANGGELLRTWTCRQAGDTLGFDACGIGDVDGDGRIDFLLTSAWCGKNGLKSGRVLIVAGEDYTAKN